MAEEGNCEVAELPEHIIQVVQSFLTGKEAAQTITLSKSWHRAWLTRPDLHLDESDFPFREYFWESAKKTIQRYEDSNLKIQSFRLFLHSIDLANSLIVRAFKLCGSHLRFEIELRNHVIDFVLAPEVFESENLVGLSVKGRGIDIGVDHNVRCYKLESLCLSSVFLENDVVIPNIISSCPLIRNLSLSVTGWDTSVARNTNNFPKLQNLKCLVLSGFQLDTLFFRDMLSNFPSLKDFSLGHLSVGKFSTKKDVGIESLSLDVVHTENRTLVKFISSFPSIQNLSLSYVLRKKGYGNFPINLPKLDNLKCLTLRRVKLKSLFLSYKLPALKHLTLKGIFQNDDFGEEEEEIRVSSRSLERLELLGPYQRFMFKFDVPSIQKFVIEARSIPSVSFESTSEEWESHVSFYFNETNPLKSEWFVKLNELLTALSPSKSHLSINGSCDKCFVYKVRYILQGLRQPQPRLDNLTLDIQFLPSLNCYALFDGLFRICRPQLITQYQYLEPEKSNTKDFLSERLEQGINGEFSSPGNFMYGLHGLKEVHVQVLGVDVVSDLSRKSKTVASENTPKPKQKIIFQLVWKQETTAHSHSQT